MDNEKTIGRANTSGSSPVRSTPTTSSSNTNTPQNNPLPPPSTPPPPTTVTTIANNNNNNNNTVWPTVYNQYELSNRIGQGAFASVWRARIKNTSLSNNDDDGACEQQQQQVECAIKIMDLEHVNINISGE